MKIKLTGFQPTRPLFIAVPTYPVGNGPEALTKQNFMRYFHWQKYMFEFTLSVSTEIAVSMGVNIKEKYGKNYSYL